MSEDGQERLHIHHNKWTFKLHPETIPLALSNPSRRYASYVVESSEDDKFPGDAVGALASTECLVDAKRIEFNGVFLGVEAFEALVSNPHLSGVRELGLIYCDWHFPTVGPLFGHGLARSHFRALEVLELSELRLDDSAFEALIGSPVVTQLQSLSIRCLGLTDVSVQLLVDSPLWHRLESLSFHSQGFTDRALDILVKAPLPERLGHLDFEHARLNGTLVALEERFGEIVEP